MAVNLLGSANARVDFGDLTTTNYTSFGVLITVRPTASLANDRRLVSQWSASHSQRTFVMTTQNTNDIGFVVVGTAGGAFYGKIADVNMTPGSLYRVAFRWDAGPSMTCWINGVQPSLSNWFSTSFASTNNGNAPLQVGHQTLETVDGIDGDYSEAAVYASTSGACVPDNIMEAYSNGWSPEFRRSNRLLYWRGEDASDLRNWVTGVDGSLTGGSDADHPPIVMPTGPRLIVPKATAGIILTPGTGESAAEGVMPSLHIGRTLALASAPAEGAAEGVAAGIAAGAALDGTAAEAAGEGAAPALALGHDLAPAAGESAAEGVAPSIHIGRTLALASEPAEAAAEGTAPALALGCSFAAGVGEAAGEGLVPDLTIGSSAAVDLVAGIGESAGEGSAPALAIGTAPAPAIGEAAAEGAVPSLAIGHDLVPAAGESAAEGVMPSIHIGRTLALASEPAEASASGAAPVLFIGLHGLPGIGDAIPEGLAPQLGLGAALAPGLGEATAEGLAPALDIAALVAAAHRTHAVTIADRRLALSVADRRRGIVIPDRRYTLES